MLTTRRPAAHKSLNTYSFSLSTTRIPIPLPVPHCGVYHGAKRGSKSAQGTTVQTPPFCARPASHAGATCMHIMTVYFQRHASNKHVNTFDQSKGVFYIYRRVVQGSSDPLTWPKSSLWWYNGTCFTQSMLR